jgi:hypothetical protein
MKTTFCPECGGAGFCLPRCSSSTSREKYWQRTLWTASIMLNGLKNPEQRRYYEQQIQQQNGLRTDGPRQRA